MRGNLVFLLLALLTPLSAAQQSCAPSPGFYCPSTTGIPVSCPPGYYCTGDLNNDHIPCPSNTFNPSIGGISLASACQSCPRFAVAPAVGQTACSLCAAGTYYTDNGGSGPDYGGTCPLCVAGSSSSANSTECSNCLPGTYSNSQTQTCSTCRPGSFQDQPGAAACIACPSGTYTYSTNINASTLFTPVWGASAQAQCLNLPTFGAPLICLPGTYMKSGTCLPCPLGYYCPSMQTTLGDTAAVRACPSGSMSVKAGAISQSDCSMASLLQPYVFNTCSIAPGGSGALGGLSVSAAVTSLSTGTLFFTTATALYRVLLQQTTLQVLAGVEGVSGSAADGVGTDAHFSALSAIGVDYDAPEATVVVVGDGNAVRMINVFTRQVTLLGSIGDVTQAGGIALRRDSLGSRKAYVTDVAHHRIMVFDLQNLQSNVVAGSLSQTGGKGRLDGSFPDATFNMPRGLAFLEKSMNSSKMLLVADSGNGLVRVIDTDSRLVSTFFSPLDKVAPELVAPISISVALSSSTNGLPMIYITDQGKVSVLQYPLSSDTSVKVLSRTNIAAGLNVITAMPYGGVSVGMGNVMGYTELVVLDTLSNSIKALVQDLVVLTPAGGGDPSTCHLACQNSNCGPLQPAQLCGNSFLDPGEECDDGGAPGGGCDITTCRIQPGYACPLPLQACLKPCPAFPYGPTSLSYCTQDCSAMSPPAGYTVDSQCVLHDIDECAAGTATCGMNSICGNSFGSYACVCTSTYFGDGINCVDTAYAVYTLVDIPSYPSSFFFDAIASSASTGAMALVLSLLKSTYSNALLTFLPPSMLTTPPPGFALNLTKLTTMYTSISVDSGITNTTRLQLVTLFPTLNMATAAAAGTSASVLSIALSQAVFTNLVGVSVFQPPKTRTHRANSFFSPNVIDGWGMNITGVTYNRTCVVSGVPPTGGCWQVEMVYVGGQALPKSNEEQGSVIQQSKNVLYLPRIDHDPVTMKLLNPSQSLTTTSGSFFPCGTMGASAAGKGITRQATACCLRDFEAAYRPSSGFSEFLSSSGYSVGVPEGFCDSTETFDDAYPASNVVFKGPAGGGNNDLVVGKMEGMPHSEVRLLETIDYTTRTFRVLMVLEEGDLRQSASLMKGSLGAEYELTFFVGLANFKGTGGSVLSTRNQQQYITVRKSNILTLSAYGANQDPLVSAVDMQLKRIKVTDFFQPVQYLYYLQPLFTLPSTFTATASGLGIVPLESIRLIKTTGSAAAATDPSWQQACASPDSKYIYANSTLQGLVSRAQNQACVQTYLQICSPPQTATSLVTFGIPLPIGMISESDWVTSPPAVIEVEFVVVAFDSVARANVMTSLALSVELNALGLSSQCETLSASQTLADIITGDIFIGTATNDYEWDNTLQKKLNLDVPGSTPSNSMLFQSTTVQGAVMTFAALGDPAFFQDQRALTQSVNIYDIHTVNFLEPLGGKSGPTPNYDAVKKLFLEGKAFAMKTDDANHTSWLEPTRELLAICPFRPTAGHMVCITKVVSTIKNNVLLRNSANVVELRPGDPLSVGEVQGLMGDMLLQGGSNGFTEMLGSNFSHELTTKLNLNTRYRKAYVVNPVVDWSYQAMQSAQPGSTAFTVCTKIIAIGMVTINTPSGTQLSRRLLSTTFDIHPPQRRMLQVGPGTSLQPTTTQASNSMFLDLDVPGYDAVTQLCKGLLQVDYDKCTVLQFQTHVTGTQANELCLAESQGLLENKIITSLQTALMDPEGYSQITGVFLLDYSLQGCPGLQVDGGRRLLGTGSDYVVIINKLMLGNLNGTSLILTSRLDAVLNNNSFASILGGGGYVDMISIWLSSNSQLANIQLNLRNTTANATQIKDQIQKALNSNNLNAAAGDIMISNGKVPASSAAASTAVFSLNLLLSLAAAHLLIYIRQ